MPYNGLESVVEGLCTGREGSAMSALANYIRRQMDALGKNQAEIAALAGITESTLSNILIKEKIGYSD